MCTAATYLVQQLKHLQEGLLLFKIQQIQRNEKLILELYVLMAKPLYALHIN